MRLSNVFAIAFCCEYEILCEIEWTPTAKVANFNEKLGSKLFYEIYKSYMWILPEVKDPVPIVYWVFEISQ